MVRKIRRKKNNNRIVVGAIIMLSVCCMCVIKFKNVGKSNMFFSGEKVYGKNEDLKKDPFKRKIPLYMQGDERWGKIKYGDDCMNITGCGPTCLSMIRCGLGNDNSWTPDRVAKYAEDNGYYSKGNGSLWTLMSEGAGGIGLKVHNVVFDANSILNTLKMGRPIICVMGPGDFTTEGHYIVLIDIEHTSGEIIVNDPNSKENSYKTWSVETIMKQTKNLWAYSIN